MKKKTTIVDYLPNIVGKLSYSAGAIGVDVWAAYDDDATRCCSMTNSALKGVVDGQGFVTL